MKNTYLLLLILSFLFFSCKDVKKQSGIPSEKIIINNTISTITNFQQIALEKQKQGVDFYAEGLNKSWTLVLDFDNYFQFNTASGISFRAPAVAPVLAPDYNVKRYRTVTEQGELIIQLNELECDASLSQKKGYNVTINFKTNLAKDYTSYNACGNYIPDFRLHDIWAIVEVEGIKITPSTYKKNVPMLEINISKETLIGTDGCNTLKGNIYNEYTRIYFNKLVSTKMACNDLQKISVKINEVLKIKKLNYTIENNQLVLTHNNKTRMILKHID